MAKEIKIQKTVFNKEQFDKVVDRSFKTYAQPAPVEDEPTVDDLFTLYDSLYYEIPIEGEKSHTTLIEKSSELVDFDNTTEDIQPLLDEIAILREQILEYQHQLIEANTPE